MKINIEFKHLFEHYTSMTTFIQTQKLYPSSTTNQKPYIIQGFCHHCNQNVINCKCRARNLKLEVEHYKKLADIWYADPPSVLEETILVDDLKKELNATLQKTPDFCQEFFVVCTRKNFPGVKRSCQGYDSDDENLLNHMQEVYYTPKWH